MRSAIVLGSGRSGTSMITGALAGAGYFQGDALHAARASNPRGFFESAEVNGLNEALLAAMLPADTDLRDGQRWLGVPRAGARPAATPELAARIARLTARAPLCFKDPRFSFTLPAWRALLPADTGFVCAFRHPALTATSLVREVASAAYLRGVAFDLDRAFALWTATYRELVGRADWLYVHYDQMLAAAGRARLGAFLGAAVDGAFPDPHLRRRIPAVAAPAAALELYAELCARAGHVDDERPSVHPSAALPPAAEPRVAVLAWIGPDDAADVADLAADVAAQRGVRAELVLLDATDGALAAGPAPPGVQSLSAASDLPARVEPGTWSRCADLRGAAERTDAEYVALAVPGASWLPAHLAHAVAQLAADGADLATCDLLHADEQGRFVDRSSPAAMGDVPGPFFEAGLVGRRAAFARLSDAAFFPGELELWRALRAAGRTTHVLEPGFAVARERWSDAWDRALHDAALATLAREPVAGAPALSVSLCTFNRRAVLRACLAAFARQLVPPGTFEIVLTDDGSTDGTGACLAELALPVPLVRVSQANAGLAGARNAGLARMTGGIVLFVNDDTIAFPDLIERHLARHSALRGPACVLGTFEQPPEELDNALVRHLEASNEVFGYADLTPGGRYDAFRFWTCNVSAPLAAVRAAGGYDESFRHYGCEDTDLGFRLGLDVVYEPGARAHHRHVMDFDYLRRRAQTVARAYVRFFRKHPALLREWGQENLTAERCLRELRIGSAESSAREDALQQLGAIDVGALLELEGAYADVAREVLERIGELLPDANRRWWRRGTLAGLREHGLTGFDELLAAGAEPWPVASATGRVLLAWPRWSDPASLDALLARVAPIAGDGFATLLLRRDPATDPARPEALAALQAAWTRRFGGGGDLEVLLEESAPSRHELLRLGRTVGALLPLGGEPREFLAAVRAEHLADAEAVRAWRARFEGPTASSPPAARTAPDGAPALSVIVPTRDRPRELLQLLDALSAQDLAPERFEVIVVDDGSRTPVEPLVARRDYPFRLDVLVQEPAGPGAARNRGIARARAELIVFFNDDAVPAPENLRRHLAAHGTSREPRAVLGTFGLLPRHCRDSFALAVERTSVLFAQPRMKPGVRYHGLALCTGNVSLRRADLRAVGGFDESLPYAGGEDSELGLRLERERGVRVAYDPRVVAGHDHALDVAGFAARRRVVGWGAFRIQERHPDAGLFQVDDWDAFTREVADEASERDALLRELGALCARERNGEIRIGATPGALESIEALGALELRRGILMGRRGELPAPAPRIAAVPAALPAIARAEPVEARSLVAVGAPVDPSAVSARLDEPGGARAERVEPARSGTTEPARPATSADGPTPPTPPTSSAQAAPSGRWSSREPSAPELETWPVLPIAGPGTAASTGMCARLWRSGLEPARGLRELPDPPDAP